VADIGVEQDVGRPQVAVKDAALVGMDARMLHTPSGGA
jgi:hypothetical protein